MITPRVEAQGIKAAIKELKNVDSNVLKILRKDLRTQIGPFAKQIAAAVPTTSPLSGFTRESSYGWGPAKARVSFTAGNSKKTGNHLVSIRVAPNNKTRGLYVAERAGAKQGKNNRGKAMIRNLNDKYPMSGKGGRFAYSKFRLLRPDAIQIAKRIVNGALSTINKRLEL